MLNVSQAAIRTDPELKELLPPLTEWEFEQLEMNILSSPERVTLVVWQEKEVLLDGHNRYAVCRKHKLHFRIDRVSLPDLDAAKLWIINEHLGRRHFSEDAKGYWMGKQLEYQKKSVGVRGKEKLYQNGTTSTRQSIAQQHNVGEQTVERNMRFARDVDTIAAAAGNDARTAILARDIKMTRQEVQEVAEIAKAQPQTVKGVLTQIKASHKRQDTKRIVAAATRHLQAKPKGKKPRRTGGEKREAEETSARVRKLVARTKRACIECARLDRWVSDEEVAGIAGYSDQASSGSSSLDKFYVRCAFLPWVRIKSSPTKGRLFTVDHYLRRVCEGRIPPPKADMRAVMDALGNLREMIDQERQEAKIRRHDSKWNPEIVRVAELQLLIEHIETGLDKICQL